MFAIAFEGTDKEDKDGFINSPILILSKLIIEKLFGILNPFSSIALITPIADISLNAIIPVGLFSNSSILFIAKYPLL